MPDRRGGRAIGFENGKPAETAPTQHGADGRQWPADTPRDGGCNYTLAPERLDLGLGGGVET